MSAKILVVDDEPDLEGLILQKFRRQIRDGSVNFLFAHDGVEALTMLDLNRDVDMVLSDINMPRMDGLSLLGKLQEGDENLSTVIVSAYGDMANIRMAMNRVRSISSPSRSTSSILKRPSPRPFGMSASFARRGAGSLPPNARTRRSRATSRPISPSGWRQMDRRSILADSAAKSRRSSPTSPASPPSSRRSIPRCSSRF